MFVRTGRQFENSRITLLITHDDIFTRDASEDWIASSKISQIVSLNMIRSWETLRDSPWKRRNAANCKETCVERQHSIAFEIKSNWYKTILTLSDSKIKTNFHDQLCVF